MNTPDSAPDLADRRGTLGVGEDGQWQVRVQRRLRHAPAVDYCAGWHGMLDALDVHLAGGTPAT